jgi:hypothetical protein
LSFSALVKSRLAKLGHGQKDLARAAQVTDSYISQLLGERKLLPGRDRTDIYSKMETFLQLGAGELGRLAEIERCEELKRRLDRPPEPMFQQFRDLVLRKCVPEKRAEVRTIFDGQPFGMLERLVARKMLDVVQGIAREELDNEDWIRLAARVGGRNNEEMRVIVLQFLDADVFSVSEENCVNFLDPLVELWNVDLETLRIDILLDATLVTKPHRTFTFIENARDGRAPDEPTGLAEFLEDPQLNGHASEEEIRLLQGHHFGARRPNKLYYYRALQNLRDPLHFHR